MIVESGNWSALVWTHIWQIGLLGCFVAIINLFLARRWPHLAYALWMVVLVKCIVPPIGNWPVNILGRLTPITTSTASGAASNDEAPIRLVTDSSHATLAATVHAASDGVAEAQMPPALQATRPDSASQRSVRLLASRAAPLAWLCGSVLLCGIAIGRGSEIHRRLRRTSSVPCDEVLTLVEQISDRIGLRHGTRVCATSTDIGPMVVGIRRPTIYLPETLLHELRPPQLEAMLTHELAHVRRRDTWVAALQLAAQTLWWFHPVVWWMNRELVRQRERCCDEEAVANLDGRRLDYARCLVDVLEARHRLEPMWGYPAVRPVELTQRRLEEIMKRTNMTHARAPRWCWMTAILMALLVLPSAVPLTAAVTDDEAEKASTTQASAESKDSKASGNEATTVLKYGDGKADGKKSYGGNGQLIRFELPKGVTTIRGLRIHGSRYGVAQAPNENFEITFLNEDRSETLDSVEAPYRLFKRGKENWVRVLFEKEIELPPVFWISLNFNAHQTKGVYVSYDTSTKGKYSLVGLPGDEEKPKETDFKGDWMVQVLLSLPKK
jgi:beta-lactamase regulating signal transducer with metallopeptidase domain